MIRIAICDDEKAQASYLKGLTEEWAKDTATPVTVSEFYSPESFLFSWERYRYDAALLDIMMGGGLDGIGLANEIRKTDRRAAIVFITAFEDYARQGYEVAAEHYLLKPVAKEKLWEVLERVKGKLAAKPAMVVLPQSGGNVRVKASDILYAEMFSHYAEVHTGGETYRVKTSMTELEQLLGAGFVRCHRSYIAGLAHVEEITRKHIRLGDGTTLPLSRNLYGASNRAFIDYNFS